MGRQDLHVRYRPEELRRFEERLLADADAFERMLADGAFETGVRRIGVEEELFLVDEDGLPAPRAVEVLQDLGGPGPVYQTELALYNIEVAFPHLPFRDRCLADLERNMQLYLARVRQAAQKHGIDAVAIGILPTLGWKHLELDSMTPNPRYAALNRSLTALRGGTFRIQIRGADTLQATHDNVMLEAFNTSFQQHLQIDPGEFARVYNAMQLATALAVAAAGNSPLLLGHRLWEETRIALFRQSVDERSDMRQTRGREARVFFGTDWARGSVLDLIRADIATYRVLLPVDEDEPWPMDVLAQGGFPRLKAFGLHNGTVYRWNRPCYGLVDGRPTLRIENRPLPAGPTVADNLANLAYLFGLTLGLVEEFGDVAERMPFHDCEANFYNAASTGLRAALSWLDGRMRPADELILQTIPLAAKGLAVNGVAGTDANRFLDLLGERVASGQTGSRWMLDGFNRARSLVPQDEALQGLVRSYMERQRTSRPVHTWSPAQPPDRERRRAAYERIGQVMRRDPRTVRAEDAVSLVEALMRWEGIRHVPVEDEEDRLVGIVSVRDLLVAVKEGRVGADAHVGEIMATDVVTVDPETPTLDVIRQMRERRIACMPVVREGRLVGMVSESDFLRVVERLLG
jgi:CBS domain-containing protein/gamma-glutamyl:cysteine ligase YbdK (ATP-grasp superfamily)